MMVMNRRIAIAVETTAEGRSSAAGMRRPPVRRPEVAALANAL
jgi:hypothetical protein